MQRIQELEVLVRSGQQACVQHMLAHACMLTMSGSY